MAKVLIVEDDPSIAELVKLSLSTVGYEVSAWDTAAAARRALEGGDVDLAIVDLALPDAEGLQLLPETRKRDVPVIILTARDSLGDKVRGLEAGVDDYITKPFEPLELIARIKAVLRRRCRESALHIIGDISLDAEARSVTCRGREVSLTRQEFDLLLCLMEHKGIALTREKLLEMAWGYDYAGNTRTVDVHVQRIREKLDTDAIKTVTGTGYRLED